MPERIHPIHFNLYAKSPTLIGNTSRTRQLYFYTILIEVKAPRCKGQTQFIWLENTGPSAGVLRWDSSVEFLILVQILGNEKNVHYVLITAHFAIHCEHSQSPHKNKVMYPGN